MDAALLGRMSLALRDNASIILQSVTNISICAVFNPQMRAFLSPLRNLVSLSLHLYAFNVLPAGVLPISLKSLELNLRYEYSVQYRAGKSYGFLKNLINLTHFRVACAHPKARTKHAMSSAYYQIASFGELLPDLWENLPASLVSLRFHRNFHARHNVPPVLPAQLTHFETYSPGESLRMHPSFEQFFSASLVELHLPRIGQSWKMLTAQIAGKLSLSLVALTLSCESGTFSYSAYDLARWPRQLKSLRFTTFLSLQVPEQAWISGPPGLVDLDVGFGSCPSSVPATLRRLRFAASAGTPMCIFPEHLEELLFSQHLLGHIDARFASSLPYGLRVLRFESGRPMPDSRSWPLLSPVIQRLLRQRYKRIRDRFPGPMPILAS